MPIDPSSLEAARDNVEDFLSKSLTFPASRARVPETEEADDSKTEPPSFLRTALLFHQARGMLGKDPIQTFEINPSDGVEAVAKDLIEYAESYAEDYEGSATKVQFMVKLERGTSQKVFSLLFTKVEEESPFDTAHNPTANGITAMLMQHTHASVRLSVEGAQEMIRMLQRQLQAETKKREYLERQWFEQHELMNSLLTTEHERKMDALRVEAQEKRKDEIGQKLIPMAGMAIHHLMGGKAGAGSGAGAPVPASSQSSVLSSQSEFGTGNGAPRRLDMLLRTFIDSIQPPQLNELITSTLFTPEQKDLFFHIVSEVKAEEPEETAKPETTQATHQNGATPNREAAT